MHTNTNRRWYFLAGAGLTIVLGGVGLWYALMSDRTAPTPEPVATSTPTQADVATTSPRTIIGTSVESREITAYTYGKGDQTALFVGGIHGGYEWNSILLAYEMIDYLEANPDTIPDDLQVAIIPNLNPDGLYAATQLEGRFAASDITSNAMHETGTGRFNANGVDLNRNFACNWASESSWRGNVVSAGTEPFSEPEAAALRDFVASTSPIAVTFWHSQANNVYASECNDGVLPETLTIMDVYATAGDYGAVPVFDAYPITGDAEGWLASQGIPAITVELETRTSIEWQRNLAGTLAVLELLSTERAR